MHVKAFRLNKVFVPVQDAARRAVFVRQLRRSLGRRPRITSTRSGVTVHGPLPLEDELTVHRLAAEVSDWARSSRKSR